MLIYKIFSAAEWHALQADGETDWAPIDLEDGYIHFSTAQQAQETADKHFANVENLFLAGSCQTFGEFVASTNQRQGPAPKNL